MLAGLIPGVREIRAPLAAGYIWLFAVWLAVQPCLPSEDEATGVAADVIALGEAVTPVALAVAASFVAYVLGSVLDGAIRAMLSLPRVYAGRFEQPLALRPSPRGYNSLLTVAQERARQIEGTVRASGDDIRALIKALSAARHEAVSPEELEDDEAAANWLAMILLQDTMHELPLIATRLMGEHTELFSAVDRLRGEADLRRAVGPPLAVLMVVLAFRSHWAWVFGLVVVAVMVFQGRQREAEAADLLIDAIFIGRVEAPAFERIERAAEELMAART